MKETNSASADPIVTIGRYRIRKSRLEEYLENFNDNEKFNLFDNPRSNKMTNTWIKNNRAKIESRAVVKYQMTPAFASANSGCL